jgi:hypothetical protein
MVLRGGAMALVLATSVVRADTPPSAWDFARDPAERDRWDLHVAVERLLHQRANEDASPFPEARRTAELHLEQARQLLEEADAEHSPDVRLRFDLGIVYQQMGEMQPQRCSRRRSTRPPTTPGRPRRSSASSMRTRVSIARAKSSPPGSG